MATDTGGCPEATLPKPAAYSIGNKNATSYGYVTIVTLPRHELETVIPEHDESILCVDDDPLLRRLLERMLDAAGYHCVAVGSAEEARVGRVQCPKCGLVYSNFKETGRLGCSECYPTFRSQLRPLLRRVHGSTKHVGKAPVRDAARVALRREVQRLHEELQKAVEREDFESAADLRDRIKKMEANDVRAAAAGGTEA